jgi:N utilization substance protein A
MSTLIATLGLEPAAAVEDFVPRVVTATVVRANADSALLSFATVDGEVTAMMPITEFLPGHRWAVGERYVALQVEGGSTRAETGLPPLLSATRPELVEALFAGVSPEVRDGSVRLMSIARRPGLRTKVAVAATEKDVDPIAACVGRQHNRVDAVRAALGGEQVDVVSWHPDRAEFLKNALQPAAVSSVTIDEDAKTALAVAPGHQMSAAVGGGGLNSALAGQLLGLTVRIESA